MAAQSRPSPWLIPIALLGLGCPSTPPPMTADDDIGGFPGSDDDAGATAATMGTGAGTSAGPSPTGTGAGTAASSSGTGPTTASSATDSGGTSGTDPTGAADATDGTSGPAPDSAILIEDFEGGQPGQQPEGWGNWIGYVSDTTNAAGSDLYGLVDDSQSYGGARSLRFHVGNASTPVFLTRRLPDGLTRLYVRAYVRSEAAVGNVPADTVSNHETMIGLRAIPGDGNTEIRFGGAKGALGFNIVGPGLNDAIAPPNDLWGSGPGLEPGQWHCVEVAFVNDDASAPFATIWLDDTEVRTVTGDDWHVTIAQSWLDGMFTELILGWQSFSSPIPGNDVWMDDLVVATDRIGC